MIPAKLIHAPCPITRIGNETKHHFFGYYNKSCWDREDQRILCNRVPMMTGELAVNDVADIGYYDLHAGDQEFHKLAETTAWNWQMGCQSQWLDGPGGRSVIYNVRCDNHSHPYPEFGAEMVDVNSRRQRKLPLPVYVAASHGQFALCVDYRRLFITHPTIGYQSRHPYESMPAAPEDDGVYRMDLASGEYRLICSYRRLREFHSKASMDRAVHWVSHIEIAPSAKRILLLHRWTERVEDETCFLHRLITMNADGSELCLLECSDHPLPQLKDPFDSTRVATFDYEKSEYQISHPTWRDDDHIMVWGPHGGAIHYHLYRDRTDQVQAVGTSVLNQNGHMTYSPDRQWILSDTYPDDATQERTLFLYHVESGTRYDVGRFYADPALGKVNRCDLHPRWNHAGTKTCIDSVHENQRQMYVVDLSSVIHSRS